MNHDDEQKIIIDQIKNYKKEIQDLKEKSKNQEIKKIHLEISKLEKKSMQLKIENEKTKIIDFYLARYDKDFFIGLLEVFIDIKKSNDNRYVIGFSRKQKELYESLNKMDKNKIQILEDWLKINQ